MFCKICYGLSALSTHEIGVSNLCIFLLYFLRRCATSRALLSELSPDCVRAEVVRLWIMRKLGLISHGVAGAR